MFLRGHLVDDARIADDQRVDSLLARVANALVSYVAYLGQFLCPVGLAVYYPHTGAALAIWKVVGALVVLACISAAVLACRQRYPYVLMGWLWYLVMLAPVIGLVQLGSAARADRFTYLPQIGLGIALAWGAVDLCRSWSNRCWLCGVASALVLAALTGCAWRQASFWHDSETLWAHALACTSQNSTTEYGFGLALANLGRLDEAMSHYRKALELNPNDAEAHHNLGVVYAGQGRFDEAMHHCRKALDINPDYAYAHYDLGTMLARQDRLDEAIEHYQKAVESKPDYAEAHYNLGVAWGNRGRFDEAVAAFQKALDIKPDYAEAYNNLGVALANQGRAEEALSHYQKALAIKPDYGEAHNNLGSALAGLDQFDQCADSLSEGRGDQARLGPGSLPLGLAAGDLSRGITTKRR